MSPGYTYKSTAASYTCTALDLSTWNSRTQTEIKPMRNPPEVQTLEIGETFSFGLILQYSIHY
jgi:hypothetical protein